MANQITTTNYDPKYDEAVIMYEEGLSIGDIASRFNVTRQSMWKILQRRMVQFRSQKKYGKDNHFYHGPGRYYSKRAQHIVWNAIRSGRLTAKPCEICGTAKHVRAHHDDYNKPMDVRWLCQKHHLEWHRHNAPIKLRAPLPSMPHKLIASLGGIASAKRRNGLSPREYAKTLCS